MARTITLTAMLLLLAGAAGAAPRIVHSVVSSGGGTVSSGSTTVHATAGQPLVVDASSGSVTLRPGLWMMVELLPPISTAVDDDPLAPIAPFTLDQNYPNPFNPRTVISYQLPTDSHVSLRIYSLSGRLVRELVSGLQSAGRHQVLWSGEDHLGKSVASGTYFYVLETDTDRATRKLTLVR